MNDKLTCFTCNVTKDETKTQFLQSIQDGLALRNIPSENVTYITINNNKNNTKIDTIFSELFATFPKLRMLEVNLPVCEISIDDLINANKLEQFYLSKANLQKLSKGIFHETMTKLDTLSLISSGIKTIDDFTFVNLSTLYALHLHDNNLTAIMRNTFAGLFDLYRLECNNNEIRIIENGAFSDLKKLKELWLERNKLEALDERVFDGLDSLKRLFVGHNQIKIIGNRLYTLSNLDYLSFEHNSMSNIDLVNLTQLPNLKFLNLESVGFDFENFDVTPVDIPLTSPLKMLLLASNSFSSVENFAVLGRLFPNLKELDVSNNKKARYERITYVGEQRIRDFFPKLTYLKT